MKVLKPHTIQVRNLILTKAQLFNYKAYSFITLLELSEANGKGIYSDRYDLDSAG